MRVDELDVALRARRFIADVGLTDIPVDVKRYVEHIGGSLRYANDLSVPGYTLTMNGNSIITIEEQDSVERQRFTISHEVAHVLLDIPTEHDQSSYPSSYSGRSKNEMLCDVFAAAVLLPDNLFKPLVDDSEMGFSSVDRLANRFIASRTAVASRYASVNFRPCAYILAERGIIRFVSYSPAMREAKVWIQIGVKISERTLAVRARKSGEEGPVEVDPAEWFDDWRRGGKLFEDARHLSRWDQTLSLLWVENDELPPPCEKFTPDDDDEGLEELDGILPWPGKKRHR